MAIKPNSKPTSKPTPPPSKPLPQPGPTSKVGFMDIQVPRPANPPPEFSSDSQRSKIRASALQDYFARNVLNGDQFVCPYAADCRASHPTNFYEGQLHHVGKNFDLIRNGRPFRIVVCGQEYGQPILHQTLEKRYRQVAVGSGQERRFSRTPGYRTRNPHMKGTTSLLRLLFERGLGKNHEGEFIRVNGAETHLFDAFALVNFLLCSATAGGKKGDSTPIMRKNCGRHFQAAITILQPTILVCQGAGVANWLKTASAFDVRPIGAGRGRIQKGELDIQVLEFTHPAARGNNNWGWNDRTPYLLGTVEPRVKEALRFHLAS